MSLRVGSVTPRLFASTTISPTAVGTSTYSTQTFTVKGLQTDMCVVVNQIVPDTGVLMTGARVSAANTLSLDFFNTTAASVSPASAQEIRLVAF